MISNVCMFRRRMSCFSPQDRKNSTCHPLACPLRTKCSSKKATIYSLLVMTLGWVRGVLCWGTDRVSAWTLYLTGCCAGSDNEQLYPRGTISSLMYLIWWTLFFHGQRLFCGGWFCCYGISQASEGHQEQSPASCLSLAEPCSTFI